MRMRSRHPAHRVTTAHLSSAYPLWAATAATAPGLFIGHDVCGGGGAYLYDPWALYEAGQLSNPNMTVLGQIGRGKSAMVKAYAARSLVLGRRVVILDRKGEYDRLCEAAGTTPIRLEPGGAFRLNPLDSRLSGHDRVDEADVRQDRLDVLVALGGAACRRALRPVETAALRVALDRTVFEASDAEPTVAGVARMLLAPRPADAQRLGMTAKVLAEESRDIALEFDRLVVGDLAGMVDGPTTAGLDLDHALVVFDLSAAARNAAALTVLMVCVVAWAQRLLQRDEGAGARSILVLEEAWACLGNVEVARWLRGLQKLSRQYGVQVVMVLHRLSDLAAAGDEGTEVTRIAAGLLADTETQVIHGMAAAEVPSTRDLLGLSATEAGILSELPRGRALWRVGKRSAVVDLRLSSFECWVCDTDSRMSAAAASPRGTAA
jgi:type IV secretory pathway VirB4 component